MAGIRWRAGNGQVPLFVARALPCRVKRLLGCCLPDWAPVWAQDAWIRFSRRFMIYRPGDARLTADEQRMISEVLDRRRAANRVAGDG